MTMGGRWKKAALALVFATASSAFSMEAPANDRAGKDVLKTTGLTQDDVRAMAGENIFVTLTYDPKIPAGQANSFRPIESPCLVRMSANGEGLKTRFHIDGLDNVPVNYIPPHADEDFEKLAVLHETRHCPQNFADDLDADTAALARYLQNGGDPNIVESWTYERTLADIFGVFRAMEKGGTYFNEHLGLGPTLHARFSDGEVYDLNNFRESSRNRHDSLMTYIALYDAWREYISLVRDPAQCLTCRPHYRYNLSDFGDQLKTRQVFEDMLADRELKLKPNVRNALELCLQAYRYFAEGPQTQAPPTLRPAAPAN
jgi:hypothetical protein